MASSAAANVSVPTPAQRNRRELAAMLPLILPPQLAAALIAWATESGQFPIDVVAEACAEKIGRPDLLVEKPQPVRS